MASSHFQTLIKPQSIVKRLAVSLVIASILLLVLIAMTVLSEHLK